MNAVTRLGAALVATAGLMLALALALALALVAAMETPAPVNFIAAGP